MLKKLRLWTIFEALFFGEKATIFLNLLTKLENRICFEVLNNLRKTQTFLKKRKHFSNFEHILEWKKLKFWTFYKEEQKNKFWFFSSKIWKKIETLNDFFNILIYEISENNLKLLGKKNHERKRERNRKKIKTEHIEKENGQAQSSASCS